ncbi:MAG: polymorphic toxin type 10 domain-containing protein [Sulfobacillus sp.]
MGGGFTSGGAPEFVIPNGPIPPGATTTVVQ